MSAATIASIAAEYGLNAWGAMKLLELNPANHDPEAELRPAVEWMYRTVLDSYTARSGG